MTNWISGFAENALGIPKLWGDVFGLALFALLLSLTRTVYAKFGKKIERVLLVSMSGAILCYLVAALVPNAIIGLIACAMTGITTSMLWPGMLILMEEKMPGLGVGAYALMAAGGDFGASVAPQLMGIITDHSSMEIGMLLTALFPTIGVILLAIAIRFFKKNDFTKA